MKKNRILLFVMTLWLSIALNGCDNNNSSGDDEDNSSDDDDDNDDYTSDDTDDNSECDSNHAPELLSLAIRINGEPVEMPATVYTTDKMELIFEYEDIDCNLDGGNIKFHTSWGTLTDGSFGLDGIGCSSSEEGEPFIKAIDPDLLSYLDSIYLFIMDICEEDSNELLLDIEVIYNEG